MPAVFLYDLTKNPTAHLHHQLRAVLPNGRCISLTRHRIECFAVFFTGAFGYGLIELFVRGRTHITMGLLGGAAMLFIHALGNKRRNGMLIITAAVSSALFITALEYITGLILNIELGLGIWDYSNLSFNLRGQICAEYTLKWVLVSVFGMLADEMIRKHLFKSEVFIINRSRLHSLALLHREKGENIYGRS